MYSQKFNLISFIVLTIILKSCVAQLTFHNDAHTNSFTLKAPGVQQTFTRYFGGKRTGSLMQAAPQQQQQPLLQQYQQHQQHQQLQQLQQLRQQFAYAQPQYTRMFNRRLNGDNAVPISNHEACPTFTQEVALQQPECQHMMMAFPAVGQATRCGGEPSVSENMEVHVYKIQRRSLDHPSQQKTGHSRLVAGQNKCKKLHLPISVSKIRNLCCNCNKRTAKNRNNDASAFKFSGRLNKPCRPCRQDKLQAKCKQPEESQWTTQNQRQCCPCCSDPYSASSRYQPSSSGATGGSYPFEADFQQPLNQGAATSYASYQPGASPYATQQMPAVEYRTVAQAPASAQPPLSMPTPNAMPAYADQLQQMNESYQQEQLQQAQMLSQQRQQEQLLMDLYKTPQGQGRAVTGSPGSQAFYTADQYINFLNRQHQDVFSQQQNQPDRGYHFSPMSAYTNGMAEATPGAQGMQYSPSTNVSNVNYTNGKQSYNY